MDLNRRAVEPTPGAPMSAAVNLPPFPEEGAARADQSELAALGGAFWSLAGLDTVFEVLTPDDFYDGRNRIVARALLHLRDTERWTPDTIGLHDYLTATDQIDSVGVTHIGRIENHSTTDEPEVLRTYAFAVAEASVRRQLAGLARDVYKGSGDREAEDTINLIQQRLERIQARVAGDGAIEARALLNRVIGQIEARCRGDAAASGVPTGFARFDDMTGGLNRGDLVILAARPSVGKTAIALNFMLGAVRTGARVMVFSLEMGRDQIMERLIANVADVRLHQIKRKALFDYELERLSRAQVELAGIDFVVDDRSTLNVPEMRAAARRAQAKGSLGLVIVDYLQFAKGTTDENRTQEVASISRGLKALAKEMNVPVLALSQLNRESEKNDGGRPKLSNLRDSGSIEQDADLVLFLHRKDIKDHKDHEAELIVAKHRNGECGTIALEFWGSRQRFVESAGEQPGLPPQEEQI